MFFFTCPISSLLTLVKRETQRKYKDKLGKALKGKPQDVFLQAFKAIADKKVTTTGSFRSHDKRNAIKCSVKASEGVLYPLERSLFFIPKPPIHVHFDEIAYVVGFFFFFAF